MKTAVLLSGGIESTLIAYEFKPDYAITIDYGQPSAISEIKAAKYICSKLKITHIILEINIFKYLQMDIKEWIPYRNQYLLTTAAMAVSSYDVNKIFIGTILSDNMHPDGTSEFIDKINQLFNLERIKVKVIAPYINLTSENLLNKTKIPLGLLGIVHSCTTSNLPCNKCNSCKKYYTFINGYSNLIEKKKNT